MDFAVHQCPHCEHSEPAPFRGLVQGDTWNWHCDNCNKAFQIRIDFRMIKDDDVPFGASTAKFEPSQPATKMLKGIERRLLEINGELAFLRDEIREIEEESLAMGFCDDIPTRSAGGRHKK